MRSGGFMTYGDGVSEVRTRTHAAACSYLCK
jgi:hypothetical protein